MNISIKFSNPPNVIYGFVSKNDRNGFQETIEKFLERSKLFRDK